MVGVNLEPGEVSSRYEVQLGAHGVRRSPDEASEVVDVGGRFSTCCQLQREDDGIVGEAP